MIIKRRIQKFTQACRKQPDCDIAVHVGRALLLDCLHDGLTESVPVGKGMLLYEHDKGAIAAFSNQSYNLGQIPTWDQIPFSASIAGLPGITAALVEREYSAVISNLAFDWLDAGLFIGQLSDFLRANGVFWFTAFGAGTAINSRTILAELDQYAHFSDFYEMQEIGDALAGAGFKEVSLSSNIYTLEYHSVEVLMADAYRLFGVNLHKQRRRDLGGRVTLNAFKDRVSAEIKEKGIFSEQIELLVAYGRKVATNEGGSIIPVKMGS